MQAGLVYGYIGQVSHIIGQMREETGEPDMNFDKVKWEQFEQMGVSRESLEKGKHLDDLLQYRKISLVPISIKIGEVSLYTDARLSLKASGDGTFIPVVHAIRKEPQLEREFFGHTFTDEDKKATTDRKSVV